MHWADDSTLPLLQHIAQRLSEMPSAIVDTYCDVELGGCARIIVVEFGAGFGCVRPEGEN